MEDQNTIIMMLLTMHNVDDKLMDSSPKYPLPCHNVTSDQFQCLAPGYDNINEPCSNPKNQLKAKALKQNFDSDFLCFIQIILRHLKIQSGLGCMQLVKRKHGWEPTLPHREPFCRIFLFHSKKQRRKEDSCWARQQQVEGK